VLRRDVGSEFVEAAAEVLDKGVSGGDHRGRAEPLQAAHRPESGLESAMVGFDGVRGVLLGHMQRRRGEFVEDAQVRRCLVGW
jgi:hypothetical protein